MASFFFVDLDDDFLAFFERTADEVPLVRYDPLDVSQPFLEAR